eukprot:1901130-Rhodomonas_salina.3
MYGSLSEEIFEEGVVGGGQRLRVLRDHCQPSPPHTPESSPARLQWHTLPPISCHIRPPPLTHSLSHTHMHAHTHCVGGRRGQDSGCGGAASAARTETETETDRDANTETDRAEAGRAL